MHKLSRRGVLCLLGAGALLSAGCMTKPMLPPNADGTYCFAVGKWYHRTLTCTTSPIPSEQVEAAAKRFEAAPGMLTVYIVRKRWGDAANQVRLTVDGGEPMVMTPESFVRLRMRPGSHTITAVWSEGSTELAVTGAAGEMRVVELVGSVWAWGSTYRLEHGDAAKGRSRVSRLRLVADLQ